MKAASRLRRATAATLLVLAVGQVAGCAGTHSRLPTRARSVPLASPSPTSPSTHPAKACTAAQLHVQITHTYAAGGSVGGYLTFTNVSDAACRLTGWPELVGLRRGVSTRAVHVRSAQAGPYVSGQPVLTLALGQRADAVFAGGDNPGPGASACPPPYTTLRVTPPGTTTPVTVSGWNSFANTYMPSCAGLAVTMVVPPAALYQG